MGQKSSHEYTIIKLPKDFPDKTFVRRINREYWYTDIDLTDKESCELCYKVMCEMFGVRRVCVSYNFGLFTIHYTNDYIKFFYVWIYYY